MKTTIDPNCMLMFFKMFLTSWSTLPRMSQATSEKCTERYSTEDPSTTIWRWSPLLTSLIWTSCSKLQRQAGLFATLVVISGEYCGYSSSSSSCHSCPLVYFRKPNFATLTTNDHNTTSVWRQIISRDSQNQAIFSPAKMFTLLQKALDKALTKLGNSVSVSNVTYRLLKMS